MQKQRQASPPSQANRELVAELRHELNNPLNQILGYAELILEEAGEEMSDVVRDDLARIRQAAQNLGQLIKERIADSHLRVLHHAPSNGQHGPNGHGKTNGHLPEPDATDATGEPALLPSPASLSLPESSSARESAGLPPIPGVATTGHILVVDDIKENCDLLTRHLQKRGHLATSAHDGESALSLVREHDFDLILLDVLMPGLNGFQTLRILKQDPALRHIPVLMISALSELDNVVRCIEYGAEDFLTKPFNPTLLAARVESCLQKKLFHDHEKRFLALLKEEKSKADRLLLNILPQEIADRLKESHDIIADHFEQASVLFFDLVEFTKFSSTLSPPELVNLLNLIFSRFDALTSRHGLEKIKTIGDAYMAVGGIPTPDPLHAAKIADLALGMIEEMRQFNHSAGTAFRIRIGISSGPVVAGVIGTSKFSYDLWGDTVNTASRMESTAPHGEIQVSPTTYALLADHYEFTERLGVQIKGKGEICTYLLKSRRPLAP